MVATYREGLTIDSFTKFGTKDQPRNELTTKYKKELIVWRKIVTTLKTQ